MAPWDGILRGRGVEHSIRHRKHRKCRDGTEFCGDAVSPSAGSYKLLHRRAEWLDQDPACVSPTQKDGHRTCLDGRRPPNMPGEGSTLGSNRYSPEQAELVEQRARAVSDTGERIVANR